MIKIFKMIAKQPYCLLVVMVWLLPACTLTQPDAPVLEQAPLPTPEVLATPAAMQPAAGICAEFEGDIVTMTINPDIPDPRCIDIRPEQKLAVVNHRSETLRVRIGSLETTILPEGQHLFDLPFGDYLAPGVHLLDVFPCCGGELVLSQP
jgi:hypothetical protein